MQLKGISFPKNHIQSPFSHQMPDGQILSITEKKTQIIALSVLVGIFTFGIGGLVLFYSLAAKYKIEQIEKFESEATRETNLSSISAESLSHICAYLSVSDLNSLARVNKQTRAIPNNKLIMIEANNLCWNPGWNPGRDEANLNIQSAKNYLSELFTAVKPRFCQYRDSLQIREAYNLTDGILVYDENYHKMLQIAHNLKSLTKIKLRNLSIEAIEQGDTDIVKLLVHLPDENSITLLHWLAEQGHYKTLKLFIERVVDINVVSQRGDTLLHWLAEQGHYKSLGLFIEGGADINVASQRGDTPLHLATWRGHYKTIKLLIDKRANINVAQQQGGTPLHYAADRGRYKIAKLLIDKGAEINAAEQEETPLLRALSKGHYKIVKLLIDNGADTNAAERGQTPLHWAAKKGHYKIVKLLIDGGAKINTANHKGSTPLHYALYNGQYKIAVLLVEKGADVKLVNDRGRIPFDNVIKKFLYYCYSWKMMQRLS